MFVKLKEEHIYSIITQNLGRGKPCGDVWINLDRVDFIDDNFVYIGNRVIHCTDDACLKIVAAIMPT